MAGKEVFELQFLKLHERPIRYLLLPSNMSEFTNGNSFENNCIPLFYGADVMKGCGGYDSKNLPRTHNRFGEQGLATNFSLPVGCRLKGVRGAATRFWFYSIQGLFKIAFQFYSRQEQKDMFMKLQSEWMLRLSDSLLAPSITLSSQDPHDFVFDRLPLKSDASAKVDESKSRFEILILESSNCNSETYSHHVPTINNCNSSLKLKPESGGSTEHLEGRPTIIADTNQYDKQANQNSEDNLEHLQSSFCGTKSENQTGHCVSLIQVSLIQDIAQNECISKSEARNCNKGSSLDSPKASEQSMSSSSGLKPDLQPLNLKNRQKFQTYCKELEKVSTEIFHHFEDESSCEMVLSYLESFIALCLLEKDNITKRQSTAFPIKLIKDYMEAKALKLSPYEDEELAIHVLASWVGEKFNIFKGIISENVNRFKQKYIDNISEMPPPKEIIKQLYPSAMYSLLYLWKTGPFDEELTGNLYDGQVKDAASLCQLLVLELMNGVPITGIGHYLFSLLQAQSLSE